MKKGILLAGLAASLVLVTGCGAEETKRNLRCTFVDDASGASTTSVMDINFNGDKAENITLDITIDYTEDFESYASIFKQTMKTQKTNLEDVGYKVTLSSGKGFEKLSAYGTYETLDASESTGTYEATKKSLEASGYVCK